MNLADLSIKRPIFITCIVLLVVFVGGLSLRSLPVDLFPDVNLPVVVVTTAYPGAGPKEIETLVTKPLEDQITTISGLKRLSSKSYEGVSQVVAEFKLEVDIKYAEQQVRDRVGLAKAKIPREAKEPIIKRVDPADQPVITLAIESNVGPAELFDLADQVVKPRLEQVNDVGTVEIFGGRKREIHVYLDRKKLREREISASMVAARLGAAGENVPSGKVDEGAKETSFRTLGEFRRPEDVGDTLVNLFGNDVPTRIRDIGTVKDTLEDEVTRAFVNGKQAVFVNVYRQSGSNTLAVVRGVKAAAEKANLELSKGEKPAKISVVRDAGKKIGDNVNDVEETILLGILLTVIVVYFFLGSARSTVITGLALPNSLLGAFILMAIAAFSVNIVTLLSLSLAVGLLIDDAIVVRENIFRYLENGADPVKAAREGTKEVTLAVVATTLVIIAMFGPVGFMKGIIGQFLKQFGLTICFAMAISLFDALTMAPMLSAYFAGRVKRHGERSQSTFGRLMEAPVRAFGKFQDGLENLYERVLRATMRRPALTLAGAFVIFLLCMSTVAKIPKTFIPEDGLDEFIVKLELPPGTSIEAMTELSKRAEAVIRQNKEIAVTSLTVGTLNGETNRSEIYARLVPLKQRKATGVDMKMRVREQLKPFAEAKPKVGNYDPSGGGQNSPFTMNLVGTDQEALEKAAEIVKARLLADKRMIEVDTSYRPGKPEFQVRIRPGAPEVYGVNTSTVGAELRAQVEGVTAAKFRERGREYDVRVRMQPDQRNLREGFKDILVPNVNMRLVRLSSIAEGVNDRGPATIDRQDRGRYIQFTADIARGKGLGDVIGDIDRWIATEKPLPPGVRHSYWGAAENFKELGESMLIAISTGILFMFLVLASLYESFITPFAILLALPLAICGAFLALFLFGGSINLFAALGIIMLLGVASKNSILLVDYANHLMADGMTRFEAMVKAGRTRLRPILMTSFALIAGMIPIAIGLNEASQQRTSMGIGIIGGLLSSTLLTLVVVPAAFLYIDRFRVWFEGLFRRMSGRKAELTFDDEPRKSAAGAKPAAGRPYETPESDDGVGVALTK